MRVYVVTNVEAGWDCVIGVYASLEALGASLAPESDWDDYGLKQDSPYYDASLEELEKLTEGGPLIIHEVGLEE